MTRPAVFLGPSLPVAEARAILEADFLPPAGMGDVYAVLGRQPPAIAIVDGVTGLAPTVRHREVLVALARGIAVYGAADAGALLAAELAPYGMVGVGHVFAWVKDGVVESDDEVVQRGTVVSPPGPPLTPLVDILAGVRAAVAAGAVSEDSATALLGLARARFHTDRSWERLLADGVAASLPASDLEGLRQLVRDERPDIKREDALTLLLRMRDGADASKRHAAGELRPEASLLLRHVIEDVVLRLDASAADDTLRRRALRLHFLAREAAQQGLFPTWVEAIETVSGVFEGDPDALRARVRALEDELVEAHADWLPMLVPAAARLDS